MYNILCLIKRLLAFNSGTYTIKKQLNIGPVNNTSDKKKASETLMKKDRKMKEI